MTSCLPQQPAAISSGERKLTTSFRIRHSSCCRNISSNLYNISRLFYHKLLQFNVFFYFYITQSKAFAGSRGCLIITVLQSRIFAGVPWGLSVKRQWCNRKRRFSGVSNPANIRTNLVLPETRVTELHLTCDSIGLSSFKLSRWAPKTHAF